MGWFRSRFSPDRGAATAVAEHPSAPAPGPAAAAGTAAAPAAPSGGPTRAPAAGWMSREQLDDLVKITDEAQLARRLIQISPDCPRDEMLFRYHLSRVVMFGEFELPILPATASRLLTLSRDTGTGVSDIARVVEADAALVRAIIRASNSAFFSSLYECAALNQAIVRIGLSQVEQIAMAQTLRSRLVRIKGQDQRVNQLGLHGLAAALAARHVAQRTGAAASNAYLGGLFHDVGKLVLLGIIARVQNELRATITQRLLNQAFGAFHTTLGEMACRSWEMPAEICRSVAVHHDPVRACEFPLDATVYLANVAVRGLERPDGLFAVMPGDDPVAQHHGLERADLDALRHQAASDLKAYRTFTA